MDTLFAVIATGCSLYCTAFLPNPERNFANGFFWNKIWRCRQLIILHDFYLYLELPHVPDMHFWLSQLLNTRTMYHKMRISCLPNSHYHQFCNLRPLSFVRPCHHGWCKYVADVRLSRIPSATLLEYEVGRVLCHNLLLILTNERRELAIWSHIGAFHFFLDDYTIARDKQGHVEF